ncbi:MAG: hypothetical protein ACPGLY_00070 [Rubripirellula sp.]
MFAVPCRKSSDAGENGLLVLGSVWNHVMHDESLFSLAAEIRDFGSNRFNIGALIWQPARASGLDDHL